MSESGGFNWGLRPKSAEQDAAVAPEDTPTEAIAAVDVPTEAMAAVEIPTEAMAAVDIPTEAISAADIPTQAAPVVVPPPPPPPAPTEPLSWRDLAEITPREEPPQEPTSAIDSLFGESEFQEYEEIGLLATVAAGPGASVPAAEPTKATTDPAATTDQGAETREPRAPLTSTQRIALYSGAIVVAVLAIVALFLIGQKIGASHVSAAPTTAPTSRPTSTTAPSTLADTGPVAPGVHAWDTLRGGECIQPFSSPWQVSFTTVDCTKDHAAQLLLKGTLPDAKGSKYPSASAMQAEITPLCSAPTVMNYSAAGAVTDAQLAMSYPATEADWNKGDRTFYCFVTRASGGTLPGSLAAAPAG